VLREHDGVVLPHFFQPLGGAQVGGAALGLGPERIGTVAQERVTKRELLLA